MPASTTQSTSSRQQTASPNAPRGGDRLVTLYARAWGFFDQNKRLVYGALGALVVLVLLVAGYLYYQNTRQEAALELLNGVVATYEAGDYRAALDGTDGRAGLLQIADEYGSTQAGNLARFYAADALYQLGEYEQALQHFQAYDKEEDLLGASAIAAQAAIYENQGNFQQAGEHYQRAANFFANEATSPQYLLGAGRAYEEAGAFDAALAAYRAIGERYPESPLADQADRYIARAEAKQARAAQN